MRCLSKLFFTLIALSIWTSAKAADPAMAGIWHGTLGKKAITLCMSRNGDGRYYYGANPVDILLQPKSGGGWQEQLFRDETITGYWELQVQAEYLLGNWRSPSTNLSLPIKLDRRSSNEGCDSVSYQQKRLDKQKVRIGKTLKLAGKAYRYLSVEHVGGLELLPPFSEGIARVNQQLRQKFETDRLDALSCFAEGAGNEYESETSIDLWTRTWLVVIVSGETFCSSPHPNPFYGADLFNLTTGQKTEPESWFKPSAWKSSSHTISANSPLGHVLFKYLPRGLEQECLEGVQDNEYYSLWPTPKGMLFKPSLPYILKFCSAESVVPYAKLKPFLNADGLAAVNELMQEYP